MTTITTITGSVTTTDTRAAGDIVYLVSAVYATGDNTALNITSGANVELVFRSGGSVFNTLGGGAAVFSSASLNRITVNDGSSLLSAGIGINVQSNTLFLTNFGTVVGTSYGAIYNSGDGSTVTNYGEIRGIVAYSSATNAGSSIYNFGTFRANNQIGSALDLGKGNDTVENHGTVFGVTKLYAGTDRIFNEGTMRASTAILGGSGDKSIVNSGLIATMDLSGDAIFLGNGNDSVTNLGQILGSVELGDGINTFFSGENGSTTGEVIGGSGVDVMTGGANADVFIGGNGEDILFGGDGNDDLDGGTGNDLLEGGTGSDIYVVDNQLDSIVELKGQGIDTVYAAVSYTLKAEVEVEYLTAGMAVALTLVGNEFGQTITGTSGADILNGGAGADVLVGASGDDTYVLGAEATGVDTVTDSDGVDTITSTITRSLASYADIENLTLLGGTAIDGTGNALANTITGNAAANVLNGGAGADKLVGGLGNDTYVTDGGDTIVEATNEGTDTVQSSLSYTLGANLENLTLTGTGAINGTGNTLANTITGNAAANVLNGGTGADKLVGGAGDDTYVTDGSDTIVEAANQGTDTVQSSVSHTLGANLENLMLTGAAAINGTGNTLANTITGNAAANLLNGGTGTDKLVGGAGNDSYVTDGGDTIVEVANQGSDTVQSSVTYALGANVENLTLTGMGAINGTGNTLANTITGNGAANTLNGAAGNDGLAGGLGNDTLSGGAGNDYFVFNTALNATTNVDRITDFNVPQDTIQLDNAVMAGLGATLGTLAAGTFWASASGLAHDADDRIVYETDTGKLFYDANGSAAGGAFHFATLAANLTLTNADFVVV